MMTPTIEVDGRMIDTPTRRAVLGAGVFAAGSLLGIDSSVAQAPLSPTPACHDGDEATLRQTEGPFFKPSSPERVELLDAGMAGQPSQLVASYFSAPASPSLEPCWISGRPTIRAGMTILVSACAAISSPTRKDAIDCAASYPAPMSAARAIFT